MPRFNFTNIALSNKANITDVMDNFNEIEENGITETEVNNKINTAKSDVNQSVDTKLNDYTPTSNLGQLAKVNYSYGTSTPSGGSNGDVYDQYFE